jgi:VanZ family protein
VIGRQKITIMAFVVYAILLLIFLHMPIPKLVYQANVSDKWLHFLAYMNLFFLLWFSINPDSKINWRKWSTWMIIAGVLIFAWIDELTQPYTGRSYDIQDLIADAEGILGGLVIFTFLSFWPSLLTVWAITILGVAILIKADLSKIAPNLDAVYHIIAYAGFTLIWAKLSNIYLSARTMATRFSFIICVPLSLMFFVKALSMLLGRYFAVTEILLSGCTVLAAATAACLFVKRLHQEPFLGKGV